MQLLLMSDTHGRDFTDQVKGLTSDIMIHAGDWSSWKGDEKETEEFLTWFSALKGAKTKIVVPGNHDIWTQTNTDDFEEMCVEFGVIPLIDEYTLVDGIKIYGSPRTPKFGHWAWMYGRGDYDWRVIPEGTDILVTHGPPHGVADQVVNRNTGCADLLRQVILKKPQVHVFGHIHECPGAWRSDAAPGTRFYNVAQSWRYVPL